ncbi:Kiwa anti-phage protein KwaB-like domain-containing protein [Clostridium frigidicarnis]|uniref:DUF4868 domain-containing protein n=1 Tax=Clostridium frigidicarnis TaxID=84698 RepID=A0A1I0Y701_9CLOT|nr:Kiwa anti-phage protein KwaB-like domain-containing protein [Clostridium frigidicarnis]SFB08248.1 protein of unknown function [Clostridium frigidicarnis]
MSKVILKNMCESMRINEYVWMLYFFKIDRRSKQQPYKTYKVRFRNPNYLSTYASNLLSATSKYQIDSISQVQEYDGENTKITCDKLSLNNPLISAQWNNFVNSVITSSDDKIEGKLNGYILVGQPTNQELKSVTFIKGANPITKLTNRKSVIFSTAANDELDLITDDICRLYLTVDFIVIDGTMYTFNHTFETLFDLEKTMAKVKIAAIDEIIGAEAISNVDDFKAYASQYKSAKTFITLKEERVNRIKDNSNRKKVAEILNLKLNERGEFIINSSDDASLLIRYLCYKVFQDSETKEVLEASTITRLNIVNG